MLLIIMGTTGTGKDMLADELVKQGMERAIRPTTRPKRVDEVDCERYYFVDNGDYNNLLLREEIICNRAHGDKNWRYGVFKDSLHNANRNDIERVMVLDRLTAVDFYKELMDMGYSKYVYLVSITEPETKEKALERILKHRLTGDEELDKEIVAETTRRLSSDAEDILNTRLLGSNQHYTSTQISKAIEKGKLSKLAEVLLDNAKTHWIETEDIKHDFDF